jgi:hypothetical protein
MKIVCDNCKQQHKGGYTTFFFEGKLLTLCGECRWGTTHTAPSADKDKRTLEHISTPYWVHMGLEPKTAAEKRQVAYKKQHNLTWGEMRKERDAVKGGEVRRGVDHFQKLKGGNNAVVYEKR